MKNFSLPTILIALVAVTAADAAPAKRNAPRRAQSVRPAQRARPVTRAPRTNRPITTSADQIRDMIDNQNYDGALKALGSSNDPSARTLRASVFEKMGYSHAALVELVASYRSRPNPQVLNKAGAIAFLLGESRLIQGVPGDGIGPRLALAQEALTNGDIGRARSALPTSQAILELEPSPFKARAITVASAIYNASGNAREALEVLGGTFSQSPGVDLSEVRLQRALVLFEVRRYIEALDELTFITRGSPTWYRGQTVGAWAAFHVEDYNLALGQLMNLRSPFLAAKFNPEKHLLQAVVLFQLCHFDMASRALKKLKEEYGNMNSAYSQAASATSSPSSFYNQLKSFATGKVKENNTAIDRVWDGLASQPYVAQISNSIEKLRFERKNIDQNFRGRELQGIRAVNLRVFDKLEETYLQKLAKYSRAMVDKLRNDAKESLEGALAADLEINTRIRDRLIRATAPAQKNIDFKKEVQKGYEFWPFEGEFWRDEVGGYAFATADVCEEGAR